MNKEFETCIAKLDDSRVYMYHIIVPTEVAEYYKKNKQKRLLCTVNDLEPFSSAILNLKTGYSYINMNKERLKQGALQVGDKVYVSLSPDKSQYGMPMPRELEEIFIQDHEAKSFFDKLTPGKQRSLLHLIGKFKSEEKRIEKGIILANYLKECQGALDYKELNAAFKEGL